MTHHRPDMAHHRPGSATPLPSQRVAASFSTATNAASSACYAASSSTAARACTCCRSRVTGSYLQTPPLQSLPAAHLTPHLPQLSGSFCRLLQLPLQSVSPVWHLQTPLTQLWVIVHA